LLQRRHSKAVVLCVRIGRRDKEAPMATWRMAFRVGTGGHEMWPDCLKVGVAAIEYDPMVGIDLAKYPQYEPKDSWAGLHTSQRTSLARLAYKMQKGDVIYVRQGPKIICRGKVTGSYKYDHKDRIKDPDGNPWSHQVSVKWETDFREIHYVWKDHVTVLPLDNAVTKKLESSLKRRQSKCRRAEALEGEMARSEASFRRRNSALIYAKKLNSDYKCEVCKFDFFERYGVLGKDHIVAHHLAPLSYRRKPSITTLDDIALVCDNCHSMLHRHDPPLTLQELKTLLK
jgi:hypothetical protein